MMMKPRLYNSGRRAHGLTLGEMMVVLAVFSILAIMFFMSSSHALVKTRQSRAMSDMREVASALQRYEADYLDLPSQKQGLDRLASCPIPYLPQIPLDPFTQVGKQPQEYYYIRDLSPTHRWLIISAGPDGHSDVKADADELRKVQLSGANGWDNQPLLASPEEARRFITEHSYDPTNGTISAGDIIHVYGE